jgi:iron complex outermembrane receptor protein
LLFPTFLPASGVVPLGNEGRSFNKTTSLAAYAQLEYKITSQLELVAGARITHDSKPSSFRYDIKTNGVQTVPTTTIVPPTYKKTKPNFLVGLNWKPTQDLLVYGKFSTSFVSGGSTAGIEYQPETATSYELGLKADLLDHRLRTNLALFHVDYNHFQSPQGTSVPSSFAIAQAVFTQLYGPTIGAQLPTVVSTFVIDQGKVRAQGFELEVTAAPTRGLTLGTGIGYTDVKFPYVNPVVLAGVGLAGNPGGFQVTARPKWTVSLFGAYETEPLFGDATLMFRADGQYRSSIKFSLNPANDLYADGSNAASVLGTKGFMLVNGRVALRHLKFGPAEGELAFWGKNITNRRDATFSLALGPIGAANNYVAPRTYGVDLSVDF